MKKQNLCLLFCGLLFVCLLDSGCVSNPNFTKFTDVRNHGKYPEKYLDRIIVVGKPILDENRVAYENAITRELNKRRIIVVPGNTIITDLKDITLENMKQAASEIGVKDILIVKLAGINGKNLIFRSNVFNDLSVDEDHPVRMGSYLETNDTNSQARVRIEAGLFEVESEKLIWAMSSEIMDYNSADTAINDFSGLIIEQLTKDGYLH